MATLKPETPTFLSTCDRPSKPRALGITHVLDKGMPVQQLRALMPSISKFVDVWKFGWGLSYSDPEITAKILELSSNNIKACPGGTLLEISWQQGKMSEFFQWTADVGFQCLEVSNGATDLPVAAKRELIAEATSLGFEVLAEVGSKDPAAHSIPAQWVSEILGDIEAGASWIVAEGRESGTVGMYESDGQVRAELVKEIENSVEGTSLIYEAPRRSQQAWLIRNLGPHVNLGNIAVAEIPSVESLRLGLRTDTIGVGVAPSDFDLSRSR